MSADTTPVIAKAVRSPQGRKDGVYGDLRLEDISIPLIEEILDSTGLSPDLIDDLMWGVAHQRGKQDNNVARVIALLSSLGEETPATTINRWCASSMQSLMSASDAIRAGQRTAVIAGGGEFMTDSPVDSDAYKTTHPDLAEQYDLDDLSMGMTAEKVARKFDVSREEQDRYSARSHERATEATESGRFDDEIVPIETDDGVVDTDETIRPDTSFEALQDLPPVFTEGGTVTAGNASQISDGAAATLVTSEAFAEEYGLEIMGYVGDHNVAGVDPTIMGVGPVPATEGLLERTGESIDEFDLVELNEAFASQTIYSQRELGIPDDRFNVNGGAIALGHPLGASGTRLPVTLLHEMIERDADKGLATMCVGFGQGASITLRRE
jgi:acetyl-CoA acyltransferase